MKTSLTIITTFIIHLTLVFSAYGQDPLSAYVNSTPTVNKVISKTQSNGLTLERFNFKSRDGVNTTFGILVYPENTTGKLPAVMAFHGGGGSAETELKVAKNYAEKGFISLSIDVPHICQDCPNTTGPFTSAGDGEGPRLDVEDGPENCVLADAMIASMEGFNYLASHKFTDSENMGITGNSWGGYTTTMMSGLLTTKVKAAFAVYGCGFWDRGSFWYEDLNDLSSQNKETWLTYFDAGRRAPHITANYFIDSPTNDTFFWPVASQATLDTITSYKNHTFGPNQNHKQIDKGSRYQWMEHYLMNEEKPGFIKTSTLKTEQNGQGKEVTFRLTLPENITVSTAQLWFSLPDGPVPDRTWESLNTEKLNDTTYTAQLTDQMI
jgi:cephalosporin-C deacetylase-like acetyl esterase